MALEPSERRRRRSIENWEKKFGKYYDEVNELLSEDEWRAASRSTINAHYTSRDIIENGLWAIAERLGFKGAVPTVYKINEAVFSKGQASRGGD